MNERKNVDDRDINCYTWQIWTRIVRECWTYYWRTRKKTDAISLFPNDSIDDFKKNIIERLKSLDTGKGVMVFVDLYGGTPSNSIALNLDLNGNEINIECITGVNLPMLLEALTMRNNLKLSELKKILYWSWDKRC